MSFEGGSTVDTAAPVWQGPLRHWQCLQPASLLSPSPVSPCFSILLQPRVDSACDFSLRLFSKADKFLFFVKTLPKILMTVICCEESLVAPNNCLLPLSTWVLWGYLNFLPCEKDTQPLSLGMLGPVSLQPFWPQKCAPWVSGATRVIYGQGQHVYMLGLFGYDSRKSNPRSFGQNKK